MILLPHDGSTDAHAAIVPEDRAMLRDGTVSVRPREGQLDVSVPLDADDPAASSAEPQPLRPRASSASVRTDVLVAGGGPAALEALLCVRAHDPDARLTLLAPEDRLQLRPLAAYRGLLPAAARTVRLRRVTAGQRAGLVCDRLARLDPERGEMETEHGGRIAYSSLVVATGARAHVALPGAVAIGHPRHAAAFDALVARVRGGSVGRLAVVVPPGVAWSLPGYEVALALRRIAPDDRTRVTVVTAEATPMEAFGMEIGAAISALLSERGIELSTATFPDLVADGSMWMPWKGAVAVDEVVALARFLGPAVPGLPHDRLGFVPVDGRGRVEGLTREWAAGDVTDGIAKQGGLALQQAEAVARDIVAGRPADLSSPASPVLRATLADGDAALRLRAERGDDGVWRGSATRTADWNPAAKIEGGRLAALLDGAA